jgi:soluble lytic murein transglycosylase-like protein
MKYLRPAKFPRHFWLTGLVLALPFAAPRAVAEGPLPIIFSGPAPSAPAPSAPAPSAPAPVTLKTEPATAANDKRLAEALKILSAADADRYARIFDLQKRKRFADAEQLMRQTDNDLLKGYVLFQLYTGQYNYRATYAELAKWMSHYPDMPGADIIYKAALRIQPRHKKKAPPLLPPLSIYSPALAIQKPEPPMLVPDEEGLPVVAPQYTSQRHEASRVKALVHAFLEKSDPQHAEEKLMATSSRDALSKTEFARTLAAIASSYFRNGYDQKALALADISAPDIQGLSPLADWVGGLAAWKLNDCASAAKHFENVAHESSASRWQLSAGAFWAARARLLCRQPERVNDLLRLAASHSRTFYGLIAARQLGQPIDIVWDLPPLSPNQLEPLLKINGVKRAAALAQIGQKEKADLELKIVWQRYPLELHEPLLGLAARLNLPTTQIKVAKTLADQSASPLDSALYPLPDWEPKGGYSIDRALIFAFMRQESEFNPAAKSVVGATGLMQLMPATASLVGKDRSLESGNSSKLLDPAFNMQLGQRYITRLLDKDVTSGNLFLVASSYNSGPGNVARWVRKGNFMDDPLLFIECIPMQETRDFVGRVISNMWIYQMRTGQPTPTLDDVAAGKWPMYQGMNKVSDNNPPAKTEGGTNARD